MNVAVNEHEYCHQFKFDCFAYGLLGRCNALENTDFKGDCPFYKTFRGNKAEQEQVRARLESIVRHDLVEKYIDCAE